MAISRNDAPRSCRVASSSVSPLRGRWCWRRGAPLDEPLGALDAQLRKQLQLELRAVNARSASHRVRDARPGGSAHDERPDRRAGRGACRAGGSAGRDLRRARDHLRRRIPGHANIFDADVPDVDGGSQRARRLATRLGAAVDTATTIGPAAIVIRPNASRCRALAIRSALAATSSRAPWHRWSTSATPPRSTSTSARRPRLSSRSPTTRPAFGHPRAGTPVNCVCTHDAVRVLHRSSATPIADPVADEANALSVS